MKDLFVPYKQALILKELGFNETCLTFYDLNKNIVKNDDWAHGIDMNSLPNSNWKFSCLAPLYQQVFKWFRDKHGLYVHIQPEFYKQGINFCWQILWYEPKEKWTEYNVNDGTWLYGDNGEFPAQEDAELACIREMIKIVKEKI